MTRKSDIRYCIWLIHQSKGCVAGSTFYTFRTFSGEFRQDISVNSDVIFKKYFIIFVFLDIVYYCPPSAVRIHVLQSPVLVFITINKTCLFFVYTPYSMVWHTMPTNILRLAGYSRRKDNIVFMFQGYVKFFALVSTIRIILFRNARQFIIESLILLFELLFCSC